MLFSVWFKTVYFLQMVGNTGKMVRCPFVLREKKDENGE